MTEHREIPQELPADHSYEYSVRTTQMRRHTVVLLLLMLSYVPAAARSPVLRQPPPLAATVEPGVHAGTLVLTFHNGDETPLVLAADHSFLTVELADGMTSRTLRFAGAPATVTIPALSTHAMRIDLDDHTRDLAPNRYDVTVTWRSPALDTVVHTSTQVPYRCGLAYAASLPPVAPPSPSRLPYALGALALAMLVVGWRLAKPGTTDARVPDSVP